MSCFAGHIFVTLSLNLHLVERKYNTMTDAIFSSPVGIITVLAAVASFFFFLEKKTSWKIFNYFPPLIFIYNIPVLF